MSTQPIQKSAIYSPIGYKLNLKRAMVNSLKTVFNLNHPDTTMKNLFISMEWNERPQQFPCLMVSYAEKSLKNIGVGHLGLFETNKIYKRWLYEGTIMVTIFAHTSLQRDFISDQFVNMFSFGGLSPQSAIFMRYFHENQGLDVQVMSDILNPLAESAQKGSSWGVEDVTIYSCGYSFGVLGSYHSADESFDYVRRVNESYTVSNR